MNVHWLADGGKWGMGEFLPDHLNNPPEGKQLAGTLKNGERIQESKFHL